jgi:TrbL/VirB6 plasmid conjugal transfer protein
MCRLRLPRKTAIALAALVTVLAVPHAVGLASPSAGHTAPAGHSVIVAQTDAKITPATSASGPCSVPGIGDIGGLLGFCSLGSSGLIGDLNNICQPSLPDPEPANSGIDAMVAPPATGKPPATLYDEYGVAGDYWAATNLQCSDMTSLIGNNVAGMVFDAAKSIDRVTITVYQSAASNGILSWLQRVTDRLITSLGHAIYFPYLAIVVILGAIWLAWQGLIRKRGTLSIEGIIWMVVACAAAILLIGEPAAVTGLGTGVSNGMSQALDAAFAKLPNPGPSSCVPLQKGDPQSPPATYSYTSGGTVVDQNADELWTVLVCQPWLDGEFGTSTYSTGHARPTPVNVYGRSLLWAQAIAGNEKPTAGLLQAKQAAYSGIASSIQSSDPGVYPLFQGKQWTTRLEIAFAALFAAVVAGILILLIAVTLILLKLGFLLLLIAGPFFLLVGTHPGFGRVLALRWVELLVGVLLKQAAVAVVLSVLLYCYALIMGTSNATLGWALKILMIALVTVAAFIYRKPFQHLFAAVGYGVIGSREAAAYDLQRAGATARANTTGAATVAVPGFAAYRAGRWARRNPGQAAALAMAAASGGSTVAAGTGVAAGMGGVEAGVSADGSAAPDVAAMNGNGAVIADGAGRAAAAARIRAAVGQDGTAASDAPPLNLRARTGPGTPALSSPGSNSPAPGGAYGGLPSPSAAAAGPGAAGPARPSWPAAPSRLAGASAPATSPGAGPGPSSAPASGLFGSGGGGSWPGSAGGSAGSVSSDSVSAGSGSRGAGLRSGSGVIGNPAAQQRRPGSAPGPLGSGPRQAGAPQPQPGPVPRQAQPGPQARQSGPAARPPAAGRQAQPRRSWLFRQDPPPPRRPARPARDGATGPRPQQPDSADPAQWLGQPIPGPLAEPQSGEDLGSASDRTAPFWLRSRRRG